VVTCSFSSAWASMNDACNGSLALKSKLGSLRLLRTEDTSYPLMTGPAPGRSAAWRAFLRALSCQTAPEPARRCL
jgi:hypothetical protein